jgi:hypothetical protein
MDMLNFHGSYPWRALEKNVRKLGLGLGLGRQLYLMTIQCFGNQARGFLIMIFILYSNMCAKMISVMAGWPSG